MRLILTSAILFGACEHPEQAPLDEARARFAELVTDYSVEYSFHGPVELKYDVIDGVIQNAVWLDSNRPIPDCQMCPTVEHQFERIQRAIDNDEYRIDVEYDPVLFYPRIVHIWKNRDDAEAGEYMRNLVPLDTP